MYSIPIKREWCLIACRGTTACGERRRTVDGIGTVVIVLGLLLRSVIAGVVEGDDGDESSERKIAVCRLCPRSSDVWRLDIGSSLEVSLSFP